MLRTIIAATLALTVALPLPALAGALTERCMMDAPVLAAERCDCCTAPMAAGPSHCGGAASPTSGCGCELRADTGSGPRNAVSPSTPSVHFQVEATLLAAALTTPQPSARRMALAASPPGAGAIVSRPVLCSWII